MVGSIVQKKAFKVSNLTRVQKEVLLTVIELTDELGCPPAAFVTNERMGRNVRGTLRELKSMGYLNQPYKSGPVVPLRDIDGNTLEWTLVKKAA